MKIYTEEKGLLGKVYKIETNNYFLKNLVFETKSAAKKEIDRFNLTIKTRGNGRNSF